MNIASFSKTYGGVTVLDFPGLNLKNGTIYSVIGSNGSGKSTFAKILSGTLEPDRKTEVLPAECVVGYMPQKNYAFRMTTRANILLGGKDLRRAQSLIESLQLGHLSDKRADLLSGGEMARMALARLMMNEFDLVILDEPTAAMDMESTVLAEKLIQEYVERTGCALILVTHSLQQAKRLSREIVFLHKGKLLECGATETVLSTPKTEEAARFLEFYGK